MSIARLNGIIDLHRKPEGDGRRYVLAYYDTADVGAVPGEKLVGYYAPDRHKGTFMVKEKSKAKKLTRERADTLAGRALGAGSFDFARVEEA